MAGLVYLICDPSTELYKIGVTRGPVEKRIKQLQTGNGTEVHLVHKHVTEYPYRVESILHSRFSYLRAEGEWFHLSPDDVSAFPSICETIEKNIEILSDNPFFMKNIH